ncbi:FUSC family protein [Aliiroseovarius sediminis]|uniref:FUSC family protein n=1 Tax=Aliiroseovarius sediminis TaxID=2925839 RepID=UPI001F579D19|nr:FUSC family protein [Aliiroseovarius sediminis]MCI2394836.1 FUSC family protein [Aliiroseovarius sediminis]
MDNLSWQLRHALRMVVSGSGAYLLVFALGLQVDFSAVITAIFVTQSNVGGSYRVAIEQFFAAIAGAICGTGAAALILPQDPVSTAIALVIALTPLALLGARSPGFRVAPISAVIILLEGPGFELDTLTLALDRVLGVALGCATGVVVSLTVFPARALSAAVETAGRVAALLARQMQLLSRNEPSPRGEHGALAAQVRENLVRLGNLVEEAEQERRGRSTRYSGTPRLLRTLRRLRHDTDMLRRAGRDISRDPLPPSVAAPWCEAAESAAKTLRGIERLLAGEGVPENFDTLTPAVRNYLNALEDIRKSGEATTLPPAVLRRMFGIGFTLDQFRRDAADMIEIARGVPKPRPSPVAAVKAWWSPRA